MRINAITRSSGISAMLLLICIVTASLLRHSSQPFGTELLTGAGLSAWESTGVAFTIFITAIITGRAATMSGIFNSYCSLPLPLYGILACGIFITAQLPAAAIASLCFALSLKMLLRSLLVAEEKNSVFFGSILLGTAALIYPPCIVLIVVIPLTIIAFALSPRQSIIAISGYLLPLLAAIYVAWYGGRLEAELMRYEALLVESESTTSAWGALALMATIAMTLIVGLLSRPSSRRGFMLTRTRRAIYFFVLSLLISLAALALPAHPIAMLTVVAVPAAITLSISLTRLPTTISTMLYWAILLLFAIHIFIE